jgi:hypothetical protein
VWWRDKAKDGAGPFDELLDLFDEAEVICAYNGLGFDLPVLRKHYGAGKAAAKRYMSHRLKMFDPMLHIARATDQPYVSLGKLLQSNNLEGKTGDGLQAIQLWEQGHREQLLQYCMHDVRQLAALVHLSKLHVPGVGMLPNKAFGIASAIAAERAVRPITFTDDDFVLVPSRCAES